MDKEDSRVKSNCVENSVVCEKHFSDIISSDLAPGKDGQPENAISQEIMKMKAGVVPYIF